MIYLPDFLRSGKLRKKDSNPRPSGYEPDELPTALFRGSAQLTKAGQERSDAVRLTR